MSAGLIFTAGTGRRLAAALALGLADGGAVPRGWHVARWRRFHQGGHEASATL
jgi:hypothetical protein